MSQKSCYLIFLFCFQVFTESFAYEALYNNNNALPLEDLVDNYDSPKVNIREMNIVDRLYKRNSDPSQSAVVVTSTDTNVNNELQKVLFEKLFGVKSLFVDILKTLFAFVSHNMQYFRKYVADLPILGPDKTAVAPLSLLGPLYEVLKLLSKSLFMQ